jgi:phosphoglycerate dehydrogenase-like enzyme
VLVFVLATATEESTQLMSREKLEILARGARLVLVSRAKVVDAEALDGVGYRAVRGAADFGSSGLV